MGVNGESIGLRTGAQVSQQPLRLVLDGATYDTGLADPAVTSTMPATDSTTGRVVLPTNNFPVGRIVFGGTNTENQTINYQVILWRETVGATGIVWVPTLVAKGVATLGTFAYTATELGAATNLFADTLTNALPTSGHPAVKIVSPENNRVAYIECETANASLLEVQCERGTAATIDAFMQFGESSSVGSGGAVEVIFGEDELHVSGDWLVSVGGVRNDSLQTTLTDTNGDYGNFAVDSRGRMHVEPAPGC